MTMREMGQRSSHAIREAGHWSVRHVWRFWMAPLVDKYDGLSLNRFLAIYFAWLAHDLAAENGHKIDWSLGTLIGGIVILAASLAFGKDVFLFFLDKRNQDRDHDPAH